MKRTALRSFITVPRGAEWLDVLVTRIDGGSEGCSAADRTVDTARMIVVHTVQVRSALHVRGDTRCLLGARS